MVPPCEGQIGQIVPCQFVADIRLKSPFSNGKSVCSGEGLIIYQYVSCFFTSNRISSHFLACQPLQLPAGISDTHSDELTHAPQWPSLPWVDIQILGQLKAARHRGQCCGQKEVRMELGLLTVIPKVDMPGHTQPSRTKNRVSEAYCLSAVVLCCSSFDFAPPDLPIASQDPNITFLAFSTGQVKSK